MRFKVENSFSQNTASLLRTCGYKQIIDKKTATKSYVRQLTNNHYPRFHLYPTESEKELVIDLHLDQAKTRYQNQKAHQAEYESQQVKDELYRIYQIFKKSAKPSSKQ